MKVIITEHGKLHKPVVSLHYVVVSRCRTPFSLAGFLNISEKPAVSVFNVT